MFAPDAVILVLRPLQNAELAAVADIFNELTTVTGTDAEAVQPLGLVVTTVYVLLIVVVVVTVAPVVVDRDVEGDQEYVEPEIEEEAVNVIFVELHFVAGLGLIVTVGLG